MLRHAYDGDMKTYCILRMAEVWKASLFPPGLTGWMIAPSAVLEV